MKIKILLILSCLSISACVADLSAQSSNSMGIEEQGAIALERGDYRTALEKMKLLADSGDPDAVFGVGYLMLAWLDDPDPMESSPHIVDDALIWIRKAAKMGVPQAASTLRVGYEWGRYSLEKDIVLENCWREVERKEVGPEKCLTIESSREK